MVRGLFSFLKVYIHFKEIDKNKKKLVFTTIEDVAFMTVTMQDLREKIVNPMLYNELCYFEMRPVL